MVAEFVDGLGIGVRPLQEATVLAEDPVGLVAGQLLEGVIDEDQWIVLLRRIGERQRERRLLHRAFENVEFLLALFPLGDIGEEHRHPLLVGVGPHFEPHVQRVVPFLEGDADLFV